ncbi:MAG: M6 family metalloprotease domain-containing protein [Prevotella sp.]|nr:M6 family metalloprotease domain-containing protein [Prevotella sp.]
MNILKKAACTVAAICMAQAAFSVPADPRPKKVRQADGTVITVHVRGDEYGHMVFNDKGEALSFDQATGCFKISKEASLNAKRSKYKKRNGKKRLLINDFPTTGSPRSLVLLVEFSDVEFSSAENPKDFYTRMLNEEGFTHSNGANGSVKDFFIASSMGLFTPQFDVVGPIKLSKPRKHYGGDTPVMDYNAHEVITEACQLIDGEVDFSQYDTNGDGLVDNVYYFYAGSGQADNPALTEAIWPHAHELVNPLILDGKGIKSYACSNELKCDEYGNLSTAGIGTFVHEFGHVLGLIDHYDTFYSGFAFDPGYWDTMALGPYNNDGNTPPLFSGFERSELGWMALTELEAGIDSVSRLPELSESNFAYRISVPGKPSEYYVLENRQQQGWDSYLPGHGMLMWHIDVDTAEWFNNSANTIGAHQLVDIVEADKILSDNSRAGDAFPGTDNIRTWDVRAWDETLLMSFDDIDERDGLIRLIQKGTSFKMPQPKELMASNVEDSCMSIGWTEVDNAVFYTLSIMRVDGTDKSAISGYDNLRLDSASTMRISNLTPETEYEVTVIAGMGSYMSEPLTKTVKTTQIPFRKLRTENIKADNISDNGFSVAWDAVRDADGYLLTVSKHELSETTADRGYDFGEKADGLPATWATSGSMYVSTANNYGAAAPALRMNTDGDYLEMGYPETKIARLSFWHRASKAVGNIVIEKCLDGEWSVAETITPSTTGTTIECEMGGADRARIRYERESGYINIDDVVLSCITTERKAVEGLDAKQVGNVLRYDVSGLEKGCTYGITITATSNGETSLTSAETTVVTSGNASGIEQITTEKGATRFYDLQGRPLNNTAEKTVKGIKEGKGGVIIF